MVIITALISRIHEALTATGIDGAQVLQKTNRQGRRVIGVILPERYDVKEELTREERKRGREMR